MKKFTLGLAASFLLAATSAHAGMLSAVSNPTTGLDGFETVVVSFEAAADETFGGVDATFTGAMNQINPFTLATIFQDNNATLPGVGATPEQDSQFLFNSGDVLVIGPGESDNSLAAAISGLASLGLANPTPFAQLVIPTGSAPDINVVVAADNGVIDRDFNFSGTLASLLGDVGGDPVAVPSIADGSVIDLSAEFQDTGARPGALSFTNSGDGTLEIISASADGFFGATVDGLNVDLSIDIDAIVANPPAGRNSVAGTLTVETNGGNFSFPLTATIPEPTTLGLISLALVGLAGVRRS